MLPDATCMCVAFNVHALRAGDGSSTEYNNCRLESSVASWRVSQVTGSEIRTDGQVVPVVFPGAPGDALTSDSPCDPSASGTVPVLPPLLVLAPVVIEFLAPNIQAPCVVLNMLLDFEAGLSGVGTVALIEPSSLLFFPGTVVLAILGVDRPLAETVVLLILAFGAVLSHADP